MIKDALVKLANQTDLSYEETKDCVTEIMGGETSPVLISSFLTALAVKGETEEEIAGAAEGMRSKSLFLQHSKPVLDIVGTGGDRSNSFNISTTAAFILAAAGVPVAKHGNRAASSKSGAADCLEALGVKIDVEVEKTQQILGKADICFLFAQKYHSAMRFVGPVRKELGIRTVFNILGPLTNPARAEMMVLGVFSEEYVQKVAKALVMLGVNNALVVYGKDGLDEVSACGETVFAEVRSGEIRYASIKPEDFGFTRCKKADLTGGTPQENAAITKAVLSGTSTAPQRLAAVLNAGAGIYVANPGRTLSDAVKQAEDTIDSGKALAKLKEFIALTNED